MTRAHPAAAVRAAEQPLLDAGPPGALMGLAAFALATEILRALRARGTRVPGTRVLALVGGGNNGGDALHAAATLARRGAAVTAAVTTPAPHPEGAAAARAAGVRLVPVLGATGGGGGGGVGDLLALAEPADVWIDGLAGIGVQGGLREPLAGAVGALARARGGRPRLVVAVDTPSGIGVDDGTLPGPVLPADLTVTMGVAKPGLLLPPASALAGRVVVVDIGLGPGLADVEPAVVRLDAADIAHLWPVPTTSAHKYRRGVLGLLAGSGRYPGAGVLAAAGASAAGVGMVRYLGDDAVLRVLHAVRPEVVGAPGRVQAWALGSGVDPADGPVLAGVATCLRGALDEGLPAVLDAGGLALVWPEHAGLVGRPLTARVVLTPHAGELAQLLAARGHRTDAGAPVERADVEAAPAHWARRAATDLGGTVLLKGATTVVAGPTGPLLAQADATPWLAVAGAGDVLAGVLGALLAGRSEDVGADPTLTASLAAAATLVHGHAAVAASRGGPIAAGDVARALPGAVRDLLAAGV